MKKRILAAGISVMFAIAIAGCGKPEGGAAAETEQPAAEDYVYVAEYRSLNEDGRPVSSAVLDAQGTAFFTGVEDEKTKLYALKAGESASSEIDVPLEENQHIAALGKDAEGNLLLAVMAVEKEGENAGSIKSVLLEKITPDGKQVETVDTGNSFLNIPDFYIQNILTDKEGNYYVCSSQIVYVLKPDGTLYCEINAGTYISNMFSIKGEKTAIAYYGNNGWEIKEVELAGKALKDLESKIIFDFGTYQGGTDSELLYTQGTSLYTCNLADEEPVKILDWVECDIDSNNLRDFRILEDGRIAAVSIDWSSETADAEVAILTKKNRSEVPEKKILTYGTLYLPYFTNKDIVAFNKQSDEYRIEVKQYGDDNTDYETKASLFNADISSGKGPDIIDMYYSPVSCKELAGMGVLEDLTPYLEKDAELKREDYIENVISAYEIDGKLYAVMPFFGVRTIIGKVSDVGSAETWSMDDMIALVEAKGKDAEIISYTTKTSMLQLMFSMNENLFVNKETGECNFTGEEFVKILEFANQFPKEVEYDPNGPSEIEKIRNGKLILIDSKITSVQLYQMYEYMFGEPVNFIGYPTLKESGSILSSNGTTAAMNVHSEYKEGVWEFLRFNLTKERQESLKMANGGFPVMKSALEKQFEKDMTPEYYEDADGNQKEKAKSTWGQQDFSVDVYAAAQEQVDHVRKMIDTAESDIQSDTKLFEIVNEEAQAYFEGQKSAEDTAALIQNRVQTYVNENR